MDNITQYINDNFLHVPLTPHSMYIYSPRKNILEAIKNIAHLFNGEVVDLACGVMPYKELLCEKNNITKYIGVDLEQSEYHNKIKPDLFLDGKIIPIIS